MFLCGLFLLDFFVDCTCYRFWCGWNKHKLTEDARISAEQDATGQIYTKHVLQILFCLVIFWLFQMIIACHVSLFPCFVLDSWTKVYLPLLYIQYFICFTIVLYRKKIMKRQWLCLLKLLDFFIRRLTMTFCHSWSLGTQWKIYIYRHFIENWLIKLASLLLVLI